MFGSLALLGLMQPVAARAQTSSASEADALFHRGKERLAAGDYAEACPLLAESYSLDPASGTLLALAVCHEREGKLATAFTEYGEVAVRSRAERRKDRAGAARDKAAELEGKLRSWRRSARPRCGSTASCSALNGSARRSYSTVASSRSRSRRTASKPGVRA
jgi:tetratricopeptide (TPR) repeat protein